MSKMNTLYAEIISRYPNKADILIAEFNRHLHNEMQECPPEVEEIIDEMNCGKI